MDSAKMLRLLGLGVRGRLAVVGVEQTRAAANAGKLILAVIAADASQHSREKVIPLLTARGVSMIETASATALGAAVGRDVTAVVGVLDEQLANGIRAVQAAHGEIGRKG